MQEVTFDLNQDLLCRALLAINIFQLLIHSIVCLRDRRLHPL